jgi:hypothetical protein
MLDLYALLAAHLGASLAEGPRTDRVPRATEWYGSVFVHESCHEPTVDVCRHLVTLNVVQLRGQCCPAIVPRRRRIDSELLLPLFLCPNDQRTIAATEEGGAPTCLLRDPFLPPSCCLLPLPLFHPPTLPPSLNEKEAKQRSK